MERYIFSTVGGFLSWLVGGWSLLLTVLLILNFIDFGTGVAASWGVISLADYKSITGEEFVAG